MPCIVYTRHDGGVDVMHPSNDIFQIMQSGGWWNDQKICVRGFVEIQIERMILDGIDPDAAKRFANAVAFGGVVGHEAWDILRARDCGHKGHGFIKMDNSDLPDRWFRNAWRQNSNGNITIDMKVARVSQKDRITAAVNLYKNKLSQSVFEKKRMPKVDSIGISRAISSATSHDELRKVWPEGVPR